MSQRWRWQGYVHADVWDLGLEAPMGGTVIEVLNLRASTYQEAVIAVMAQAHDRLTRDGHYFEVTRVNVFRWVKPEGERRERATQDERPPAGGTSGAADGGDGTQGDGGRGEVGRG